MAFSQGKKDNQAASDESLLNQYLQEMEKQGFQVDHKRLHYTNGEAVICRK